MNRLLVAGFLFVSGVMLSIQSAQALQFELTDCDGTVRLMQVVESDQPYLLTIDLKQKLNGSVQLISSTSTKEAKASGDTLSFSDVWADKWKLCSPAGEKIDFEHAKITKLNSNFGRNAALGVAGVGGVTLAALGISGAFSSSNSENRAASGPMAVTGQDEDVGNDDVGAAASPGGFDPDDYPIGAPGVPLSPFK